MTTPSLQLSWGGVEQNLVCRQKLMSSVTHTAYCEGCGYGNATSTGTSRKNNLTWSREVVRRRWKEARCVHQTVPSPLEIATKSASGSTTPSIDSSTSLINRRDNADLSESSAISPSPASNSSGQQEKTSTTNLLAPVAEDLRTLDENLKKVMSAENPLLMAAAEQIFRAGGKRMRPALVFLVSRATAQLAGLEDLTPQHCRLAEIIEMIHTASLIHDDVLDESDVRRGKETVHQLYGTRVAVLAGDFIFAQTSWLLANLENIEVIKLISQVIKDFASGEIKQAISLFDCDISLQEYLDRSYYKTASLIAASTRSAAIFSGVSSDVRDKMFDYGKNLGLAFQIVDDILDFTQSTEQLGKPAGSDLVQGNLTVPVLYALEQESNLRELIESEFINEGSLEAAVQLVHRGGGIEKARDLAKQRGDTARKCLECLPKGLMRSSLEDMVDYVLERLY